MTDEPCDAGWATATPGRREYPAGTSQAPRECTANVFGRAGRPVDMEIPPLNSLEGAYWYLISVIVLMSLAAALYFGAVAAGFAPDFSQLFP